jgi:hypothetical protein
VYKKAKPIVSLAQKELALKKRAADIRHPAYVVRAPDPYNRGRWITLGYACTRKNGEEGFSGKLNFIPVGGWDRALILLPPFADEVDQAPKHEQ